MVIAYMFNQGTAAEVCSKSAETMSRCCTGMHCSSYMCM
jgi:hypothetical protein